MAQLDSRPWAGEDQAPGYEEQGKLDRGPYFTSCSRAHANQAMSLVNGQSLNIKDITVSGKLSLNQKCLCLKMFGTIFDTMGVFFYEIENYFLMPILLTLIKVLTFLKSTFCVPKLLIFLRLLRALLLLH